MRSMQSWEPGSTVNSRSSGRTKLVWWSMYFENKIGIGMLAAILYLYIFKASALWANAFYKSKCPSVCPCVCLLFCVFTFEVPFKRLFARTSQSRMSNIFRDSESLGKSNEKKWSQIWTFWFESCLKLPRKKSFFFADFALQTWWKPHFPMD